MTQQSGTTSDAVGETYDQFGDAGAADAMGGNIHVGYWDDDLDVPITEATDRLTDLVAGQLTLQSGQHLLDVGCGIGVPALRVAEAYDVRVTGVTVSAQQVATAAERAEGNDRVSFQFGDVLGLPFEDGSFDGAFAIESLLHIADQVAALTEIHRTVRPGGLLVIADQCQRQPFTGEDKALLDGMLDVYEIARINTPDEHRAFLAEAGWELLELTDISEQVRPSYGHASAAFRGIAAALEGPAAEQMTAAAELMAAYGQHPQAGYVLITARRT
ncbi:class I SAM-dependent methyltransferase [Kribbella antibiotica]|uniref:Class I SAM-dependent methyltransferase n=1 Tax=Kribbella antibiotica TaxID=190195 RepID=A0A4R4ZYN8_9ACTN|nr:methyltransferase domain-containing protein [Kribbella antibiotica]TDD63486.1 class I SAM-dependent methyltransferase [Kribbella antibiotica]